MKRTSLPLLNRRELLCLLGGAAARPRTVYAQQPAMPVIGYLHSGSPGKSARATAVFLSALNEAGFVVGTNIAIGYRWAENQYDRLPALAADLVRRPVSILVAGGGSTSALAAKAATSTTPIVFSGGGDPVAQGLVASMNRPGGNATGVRVLDAAAEGKRLGLLRELVPNAGLIGVLLNPGNANFQFELNGVEEAARAVGQQIHVLKASTELEIDAAFATLVQVKASALTVAADPFLQQSRDRIAVLAARHGIPTIDSRREFVEVGGLMSYSPSADETTRQVARYVARILEGEKPADLPVFQTTKFEFMINLKAAKALGLNVPPMLLARADEVIE
jgi:putative ABC transport system substrate-binding protein